MVLTTLILVTYIKTLFALLPTTNPATFFLENVPNLERHNEGKTWRILEGQFQKQGYDIRHEKFSPHYFGIPQIRQRMYIVGSIDALDGFVWPKKPKKIPKTSVEKILNRRPVNSRLISAQVNRCLNIWQELLDQMPVQEKIPSPLWSMEFGATYPYEKITPQCLTLSSLRQYKGSHGTITKSCQKQGRCPRFFTLIC